MTPGRFDLIILGAGPAGYAGAMRAHDLGKRVLLIERDRVGGAGIHAGALSSKTMWHLSNDFAVASRTDRGYHARDLHVSYQAVMASVRNAVSERRELLERQIHHLCEPPPAEKSGQLWFRRGAARFIEPHAVELELADGSFERHQADHFLIATGSKPRRPPGIEIDGEHILTSDHIESLPDFPASMVILGAGVIGCEYATVFGNFARTRINIIDQQPRILPFEDEDIARIIAGNFSTMGINIHQKSKLVSMRIVDGQVEYVLSNPEGTCEPIRVERALISIGRVPNTGHLQLERAGVKVQPSGSVVVDPHGDPTQSSVPHIYAAGDTTADIALVNVAELEARHAVEHMFGLSPAPIRYEALSSIMFLAPEVAAVGLNEQQARKEGVPYRVAMVSNQLVNRNIAMRLTSGFAKLLAAADGSGRLLGLRVVGPQASSTIQGTAFLIDRAGTIEDIDRCIHPHPAVSEAVQECARLLLGRSVHKPEVFGSSLLRCADG